MPPKPKYTREQIIQAALNVVARSGISALTAKELGHALNTSTTPIFTVFNSMQEVQDAVRQAAMVRFESYAHKTGAHIPVFKQIGMQMILFAREEPQLYQLVFMSEHSGVRSFDDIYAHLGTVADECLRTIQSDYGLTAEHAKVLFEHTWIHTFGIGALCATGMCSFSEQQISDMLTQDFTAMMTLLRSKSTDGTESADTSSFHNEKHKGDHSMRIAVTYENGAIFQHFGHTEQFKIYDVQDGAVVSSEVVDTNGSGHGALAGVLNALHADVLICGGIGGGAQAALAAANIKLYGGVSGSADEAVAALIAGTLDFNPDVRCNHHDQHHGEAHTCGSHGCGEHHCADHH